MQRFIGEVFLPLIMGVALVWAGFLIGLRIHDCPPAHIPNRQLIDQHIRECETCDYRYYEEVGRWMYTEGCPKLAILYAHEYNCGNWTFVEGKGWERK